MPRVDFVPAGLTAQWVERRWLEFLEGPSAGPFWGAHLGHANASAALYVCTYPRARFDAAMCRPGEDPLGALAFSAAHVLIARAIAQAPVSGAQRDALIRQLTRYSVSQADAYQSWRTIGWHVDAALSADRPADRPADGEVLARALDLAGWQAAFAATAGDYIVAYSYGADLDGIGLGQVRDPRAYGFTFQDAVLRANAAPQAPQAPQAPDAPDAPGNERSQDLHADLARILEQGK